MASTQAQMQQLTAKLQQDLEAKTKALDVLAGKVE